MRCSLAVCILLCSIFCVAQTPTEFKRPTPKVVKETSKAPVTRSEANKTLTKAWKAVSKALFVKEGLQFDIPLDSNPVSRDEVLSAFSKVLNAMEKHVKRFPRPVAFKSERLRKDLDKKYLSLVSRGFIVPYGVMTTGAKNSLTPKEFGDALGIFIIQLADVCHLPSSKFTPSLMGAG